MTRRRTMSGYLLTGALFLLLSSLVLSGVSPGVAAQSMGDLKDMLGPTKQILSAIIDVFNLDWLGNDPAKYQAFARATIFLIMFVLIYQLLSRIGHLSPKGAQIISFAISAMGVIFIPGDFLLGIGESYAAIFMSLYFLFLAYLSLRLSRSAELSDLGQRVMFILVHIVLLAMYFFGLSRLWGGHGNYSVMNFNILPLVWFLTTMCGIFIFVNLAMKGIGAKSENYSGLDDGIGDSNRANEKEAKDEVEAEKEVVKVEQEEIQAEKEDEVNKQIGDQQAREVVEEISEEGKDIQETAAAEETAEAGLRDAETAVRTNRPQDARQILVKTAHDLEKEVDRLQTRIGSQLKIMRKWTKYFSSQSGLLRAASQERGKARSALRARHSKLMNIIEDKKRYSSLLGNRQLAQTLKSLASEADQLLQRNDQLTKNNAPFLRSEKRLLVQFDTRLSDVSKELKSIRGDLRTPDAKTIIRAHEYFRRMVAQHREIILWARAELNYAERKKQMAAIQRDMDLKAAQITEQLSQILRSVR